MNNVYVLQFSHHLPSGEDSVLLIGIYRSENSARNAVEQLKLQPGFSEHPKIVNSNIDEDDQGFHIDCYQLDKSHWIEGFVTI